MGDPRRIVVIDYTNWRGERGMRRIRPLKIEFGSNEWHPRAQWLLLALDIEKGEPRNFAMTCIHSWTEGESVVADQRSRMAE